MKKKKKKKKKKKERALVTQWQAKKWYHKRNDKR